MTIAFISGHLDVTNVEFFEHYVLKINEAISLNHTFVIGDARGLDKLAQEYLLGMIEDKGRVTVYHMFDKPRFNMGMFPTKGGYQSDDERDSAMTENSHYDIAWVRPGRETSGTAKNLLRRTT